MNITTIAIGAVLALIVLGMLITVVTGIRNVINGKFDAKKIGSILVPFVVFGVSYGILGTFIDAGIATMLVMIGLMLLSIALTGMRTTFKF
ncbi:MAG: hypothetical protein ACQETE_16155 [Bacteroidota bacterium]|jgi:hypothetical protein